ncbi:Laminin subunit beta-4 [Bienertia sinuspersici]
MANFKKTQLLTLSLIATLLSFTPLLSSSFRSTYLYFIINVLIVVLGFQAGILSPPSSTSSSSNRDLEVDKKSTNINTKMDNEEDNNNNEVSREKIFVVENYVPEKILACVDEVKKMIKKCPSTPSLFFIGGNENENENENENVVESLLAEEKQIQEENGEEKGIYDDEEEEELFEKAETFIVNFYKQLKMQREESWKNFHELINKDVLVN